MVDSGAFSVWSKGDVIKRDDYVRFLEKHEGLYTSAINLDSIPAKGRAGDRDEVARAADESLENWRWFRRRGIEVMPVYHYGEQISVLEAIINERPRPALLGIGGIAKVRPNHRRVWLDRIFGRLFGVRVGVHCLGVTAGNIVFRYPWASVDSTSPIWDGATHELLLEDTLTAARRVHMQDIGRLPKVTRAHFLERIASAGFTLEDMQENWKRVAFNVLSFTAGARSVEVTHNPGLLYKQKQATSGKAAIYIGINRVKTVVHCSQRGHQDWLFSFARPSIGLRRLHSECQA